MVLALCAAAGGAGAWGCGGADREPLPAQELRIATGRAGGVFNPYGKGLRELVDRRLPRLRATTIETSGSVRNLELLRSGAVDVAFTRADSAEDAGAADAGILALARLYESYLQVVVLDDSPIRTLADLRNRCRTDDGRRRRCRVSIGEPGSGTQLIARRLLQVAGLAGRGDVATVEADIAASCDQLAGRRIDALVWAGGLPTEAIDELRNRAAPRLVDLAGAGRKLRRTYPDLYVETSIPRTLYEIDESVATVSVGNYLAVRRDLPTQIAERLTEALFAHREELAKWHDEPRRLDVITAVDTHPLDLHPGAARYFAMATP